MAVCWWPVHERLRIWQQWKRQGWGGVDEIVGMLLCAMGISMDDTGSLSMQCYHILDTVQYLCYLSHCMPIFLCGISKGGNPQPLPYFHIHSHLCPSAPFPLPPTAVAVAKMRGKRQAQPRTKVAFVVVLRTVAGAMAVLVMEVLQ